MSAWMVAAIALPVGYLVGCAHTRRHFHRTQAAVTRWHQRRLAQEASPSRW